MRACLVVVGGIRSNELSQVTGTDNQHVIETLAPYCPDQTLHMTILPRRTCEIGRSRMLMALTRRVKTCPYATSLSRTR
jgi:hypothetical protein